MSWLPSKNDMALRGLCLAAHADAFENNYSFEGLSLSDFDIRGLNAMSCRLNYLGSSFVDIAEKSPSTFGVAVWEFVTGKGFGRLVLHGLCGETSIPILEKKTAKVFGPGWQCTSCISGKLVIKKNEFNKESQ